MITGAARIAGVVGWPVKHSLSPLIHNAWIKAANLDAAYVPFAVRPEGFQAFVEGLRRGGAVSGVNVTVPFKPEAFDQATERSASADAAGAANLLLFKDDGTVLAENTDGVGLLAALAEQAPLWKATAGPVLVLGAGGAAEGAVAALARAGVPEVRVAARRVEAAENTVKRWTGRAAAFSLHEIDRAAVDVTAVINATSAGLNGVGELPPIAASQATVFMDMVYAPLRTAFLREASSRGHQTVDGLAMLIAQARPSFELFFGVAAPIDVNVRRLCLQALGEAA